MANDKKSTTLDGAGEAKRSSASSSSVNKLVPCLLGTEAATFCLLPSPSLDGFDSSCTAGFTKVASSDEACLWFEVSDGAATSAAADLTWVELSTRSVVFAAANSGLDGAAWWQRLTKTTATQLTAVQFNNSLRTVTWLKRCKRWHQMRLTMKAELLITTITDTIIYRQTFSSLRLCSLLPPESPASQNYSLRPRVHNLQLTDHANHLANSNFIAQCFLKTFTNILFPHKLSLCSFYIFSIFNL